MHIEKMLDQLRAELAAIRQAVTILENLSGDHRGGRKRKPFSAETRRKMALSQRKRWAAYKKNQKQSSRSN